jgi:uncharacterized protein (DUF488 family)
VSGTRAVVFSVGHSTRTGDELVALLREAGVGAVADVRRFPASRRHPQFRREALEAALPACGIRYGWLGEGLGGRQPARVPAERSPNAAWTEPAFRRYADAMATPAFQHAFAALERLAAEVPTAVMCAERPWWRCHRRLLADLLVARGHRVVHLLEPGRASEHALSGWARVGEDGSLSYPALV